MQSLQGSVGLIPGQARIFSGSFSTAQVVHLTGKIISTFVYLSAVQNMSISYISFHF